ncbi:hypothetical protein ACIF6H_12005 [Streptomyces microflavus]|uniref:hypothetical protein n=1 Tax=Streptomyces griseus group TaxID=629295 RepID=UPI003787794E
MEVSAKRNVTTHFQPLLATLDLTGSFVTFVALHSVRANISWLVEAKKAYYIAVIKTNQSTVHSHRGPAMAEHRRPAHGLRHQTWPPRVPIDQDLLDRGRLGGLAFPHTRLAIRVHRRRKQIGKWRSVDKDLLVVVDAGATCPAWPPCRRPGRARCWTGCAPAVSCVGPTVNSASNVEVRERPLA